MQWNNKFFFALLLLFGAADIISNKYAAAATLRSNTEKGGIGSLKGSRILNDAPEEVVSMYDYIVVGAGTAGSAAAAELAERVPDNSVLVMDMGKDHSDDAVVMDNDRFTEIQKSAYCEHHFSSEWALAAGNAWASKRDLYTCVSKILGGASAINYGGWYRTPQSDLDEWADLSLNDQWSYDSMLPIFEKLERVNSTDSTTLEDRFYDGVIPVKHQKTSAVYARTGLIKAFEEYYGVSLEDQNNNGRLQAGINTLEVTRVEDGCWYDSYGSQLGCAQSMRNGSSYNAFIREPLRHGKLPNLTLMQGAKVIKIDGIEPSQDNNENNWNNNEKINGDPISIHFIQDGETKIVKARREVLLSAGSWGNPQIAMLSGVGEGDILREAGVELKIASPNVGKIKDHGVLWLRAILNNVKEEEEGTDDQQDQSNNTNDECEDKIATHPACTFGNICDCKKLVELNESTGCGGVYISDMGMGELNINDLCPSYCNACPDTSPGDIVNDSNENNDSSSDNNTNDDQQEENTNNDCEDKIATHPACTFGNICDCEALVKLPGNPGCGGIFSNTLGDIDINELCPSYCNACPDTSPGDIVDDTNENNDSSSNNNTNDDQQEENTKNDCEDKVATHPACTYGNICDCESLLKFPGIPGCGNVLSNALGDLDINELCPSYCNACPDTTSSNNVDNNVDNSSNINNNDQQQEENNNDQQQGENNNDQQQEENNNDQQQGENNNDQQQEENNNDDCEDKITTHPACTFGNICDCEALLKLPGSPGCGGVMSNAFGDLDINEWCPSYCNACPDTTPGNIVDNNNDNDSSSNNNDDQQEENNNSDCGDKIATHPACTFGRICDCETLLKIPGSPGCGGVFSNLLGKLDINEWCPSYCNACPNSSTAETRRQQQKRQLQQQEEVEQELDLSGFRGVDNALPALLADFNSINFFFKSDDSLKFPDIEYLGGVNSAGENGRAMLGIRLYQNKGSSGPDGGSMKIRSSDPFEEMDVSRNFYATDESIQPMLNALKKTINMVQNLTHLAPMLIEPSTFVVDVNDDEALKNYIRNNVVSEMHLMSSMKMGQAKNGAVVDGNLKLIGSNGRIRVADTSIFPDEMRGHTMATAMAVGLKAAEIIHSDAWRYQDDDIDDSIDNIAATDDTFDDTTTPSTDNDGTNGNVNVITGFSKAVGDTMATSAAAAMISAKNNGTSLHTLITMTTILICTLMMVVM